MHEAYPLKELSPAQEALRDACGTITALHDANFSAIPRETELTIYSALAATQVRKDLRTGSLGDLMLSDGASLSVDNPDGRASRKKSADAEERLRTRWLGDSDSIQDELEDDTASGNANRIGMPDLKLFAGDSVLTGVGLAIRQRASSPSYWSNTLGIFLRYENEQYQAFEVLSAQTNSNWSNGSLRVKLSGHVTSPAYHWGIHYNGHLPVYRLLGQDKQDTPEEVFDFIELAHELASHAIKE